MSKFGGELADYDFARIECGRAGKAKDVFFIVLLPCRLRQHRDNRRTWSYKKEKHEDETQSKLVRSAHRNLLAFLIEWLDNRSEQEHARQKTGGNSTRQG
jgi:hypothetical protein